MGPPPMRRMRKIQMPAITPSGSDPAEEEIAPEGVLDAPRELDLVLLELLQQRGVVHPGDARGRKTVGPGSAPKKVRTRSPGRGAWAGSAPGFSVPWISLSVTLTPVDLVLAHESEEAAHRDLDGLGRDEPALNEGQDHGGDQDVDEGELRLLPDRPFHFL